MLHGFEATGDGFDQRRKVGVDEQHFVAGVVDDVHHVVDSQADVDGVNDGADGGRGEVGFQVPVGVPAEGADAVAETDAPVREARYPTGRCARTYRRRYSDAFRCRRG